MREQHPHAWLRTREGRTRRAGIQPGRTGQTKTNGKQDSMRAKPRGGVELARGGVGAGPPKLAYAPAVAWRLPEGAILEGHGPLGSGPSVRTRTPSFMAGIGAVQSTVVPAWGAGS